MRVLSVIHLAILLVVRQALDEHVCPSLAVEKEKCENEKQRAISAERENYSANVNAIQAEAGEVRKKLEEERDQCVKSLGKAESDLLECNTESEAWRNTMTGNMKTKETEHEASLTRLQQQISAQTEELALMKSRGESSLAELRKKLTDKEQELETSKKTSARKLASEKESLGAALENLKIQGDKAINRLEKEKADQLASQRAEVATLLAQKADAETLLAQKEKELLTKNHDFEATSKEIKKMKEKLKELRHQNTESLKKNKQLSHQNTEILEKNIKLGNEITEVTRKNEDVTAKYDEQAKLLKTWEDEFTAIRARHVDETAKLKKKAKAEKLRLKNEAKEMKGDVLFAGSWMWLPKGWNGVLAIDLRLFRSMGELLWFRVLGERKVIRSIRAEYRDLFSSGINLWNKMPSLDDVHGRWMSVIESAQDFSTAVVREYTPLVNNACETFGRLWKSGTIAGGDFYRTNIKPHVEVVSTRVKELYVEKDIGPLYFDPASRAVLDTFQPIYKDSIYPLYQDHILYTLGNIPQYRSQMKTFAVRLEKDLRGSWRMTKSWGRVAKSHFETRFAFMKRSYALLFSTVSEKGRLLFQRLSAPLVLFGGKVSFDGGVFEAAAVGSVVLLGTWSSSSSLGVAFGVVQIMLVSIYTAIRFLLVTVFLKLVVCTIAWRVILLGSIKSLFFLVSFVLRIIGFVLKVVFFPIKVALKLLMCILKCMCCCGLCCRGKAKSGKSTADGSHTKGMNGKLKKGNRSPADSSTSSDEGKNKKGKKRSKKDKQGSKGSSSKSEKKKRRKKGGK